jgi:hypothetical protein
MGHAGRGGEGSRLVTEFIGTVFNRLGCDAVLGAWWTFDESSYSTRSDSHGAYDLDDTNSNVPQGTGVVLSNSASFDKTTEPNQQLLYSEGGTEGSADSPLTLATSISGCCWVVVNDVSTPHYIIRRGESDMVVYNNNGQEWGVACATYSGSYYFGVNPVGDSLNRVERALSVPVSVSTPYFVYWHHVRGQLASGDYGAGQTGISVNGGTLHYYDHPPTTSAMRATFGEILVGRLVANEDSYYDNFRFDGRIDNCGLWYGDRLTNEMIAFLYNSGSGRSYAEWVAAYPDN